MGSKQGAVPHYGHRRKSIAMLTLLCALALACCGMGLALRSAKEAHNTLLQRLREEERKSIAMQQTVAEAKVDSVDNLNKARDLEGEKRSLDQTLQYTNERLQESERRVRELDGDLTAVRDGLTAAEAKVGELQRRLDHRQTEAHVLKNSMNQYKHQIANLSQELEILRQIRQGEAAAKAAAGGDDGDGETETELPGQQQQRAAVNVAGADKQPLLDEGSGSAVRRNRPLPGNAVGGRTRAQARAQAHAHAAAEEEEVEGALDDNEDEGDAAFTAAVQERR